MTFFLDAVSGLTAVSAVAAMVMMLLVTIAFRGYIFKALSEPLDFIANGIWWFSVSMAARLALWDVTPIFTGQRLGAAGLNGAYVNWIFTLSFVVGAWRVLHGFYLLIPDNERSRWTTLTAPFYPHRIVCSIIRRRP